MACNLLAVIYVDDTRMAAFEMLSPLLPLLPVAGGKATLTPLHPKLPDPIEVEVTEVVQHTRAQSVGLIVRCTPANWEMVAKHMREHEWDDTIIHDS